MSNSLIITNQYPVDKYNLLVSMQTVAEISEIQKPVMNVVSISTNLNDKEIYEQEKAYGNNPPKYAITKKGLTKLMRAAGIKIVSSRPVLPSSCQKCAQLNACIGKSINCGGCPNKDVKYEVRISVPQLTGENIEIVAHKEIFVDDVVVGMSEKQKAEFLKFRNEMCESKALNRALRTAMQIKGTYFLEEFKKPFVVAYLVPNLDHEDVKREAIKNLFASKNELYGSNNEAARRTVYVDSDPEDPDDGAYEAKQTPIEAETVIAQPVEPVHQEPAPATPPAQAAPQTGRPDPNTCVCCGAKISNGVSNYSIDNFGQPMCMNCQRSQGGEAR